MLACAHCGVHLPRDEALPGRRLRVWRDPAVVDTIAGHVAGHPAPAHGQAVCRVEYINWLLKPTPERHIKHLYLVCAAVKVA